jgi:hypothetical protein
MTTQLSTGLLESLLSSSENELMNYNLIDKVANDSKFND